MTGFRGTRNVNGRPKGSLNKTTAETKDLLQKIIGKELTKLGAMLEQLEPNERITAISRLLPYILPKQQETSIEVKTVLSEEDRAKRILELKKQLQDD